VNRRDGTAPDQFADLDCADPVRGRIVVLKIAHNSPLLFLLADAVKSLSIQDAGFGSCTLFYPLRESGPRLMRPEPSGVIQRTVAVLPVVIDNIEFGALNRFVVAVKMFEPATAVLCAGRERPRFRLWPVCRMVARDKR
jgi:hypothetical protein